jgi:hypothetical protein
MFPEVKDSKIEEFHINNLSIIFLVPLLGFAYGFQGIGSVLRGLVPTD